MTQEAVDASGDCDAIMCLTPDHQGVVELAAGLGCILREHVYEIPVALAEHTYLKSNILPHGIIVSPIQLTPQALKETAAYVYTRAKAEQAIVREVPFTGKRRTEWDAATGAASAAYSQTQSVLYTLPQCLEQLIVAPAKWDTVRCAIRGETLHGSCAVIGVIIACL